MVVTPTAVFIHFHKAGGQFMNRLLLQHVPGARRIGYHLPRSETPADLADLPTFGFVRNPWEWYVSWYAFNALNPERNPVFRVTSLNGTLGFESTIENLLRLGQADRQSLRATIAEQLPETREGNLGSGITSAVMSGMDEPERGYLTWLWRYMFLSNGRLDDISFGRLENFRADIVRLLGKFNVPISENLLESINAAPAVNISPHQHYRDYYTGALRKLIATKDREFAQEFDYEF
jgi:hypothetical protein